MPTPKRQSAFFRATQEAQVAEKTVAPSHSDTVTPLQSDTAEQAKSLTVASSRSDTVEPTAPLLNRETVEQMRSSTVTPSHSDTVAPLNTNKKDHKTSFYLTQEQTDKLDDLAYEYKKRTGQRINRNDIVRHLINQCSIDTLSNVQP